MIRARSRKVPPISVAVTKESSATELREQRQLERARRWQTERVRALADEIDAGEFAGATQAEIDAIFRAS